MGNWKVSRIEVNETSKFTDQKLVIKLEIILHIESHPMLSSEPDTIHLPPVTLKLANMQYFSFLCPV